MGQINLPPELRTKKVKSLKGSSKKLVEDILKAKFDIKETPPYQEGVFPPHGNAGFMGHGFPGQYGCNGPCCDTRSRIPATAWREVASLLYRNLRIRAEAGFIYATSEVRLYIPRTAERTIFGMTRGYNEFMIDRRISKDEIIDDMMREYERKIRTFGDVVYID